jgi:UDP-N-acetylglucosamine acyltransferase
MNDYINPRENFIHPTAQIAPGVKIGTGNYIGPFCIIGYPAEHKAFWGKDQKGVEIGDDCVLTGHVTIDSGTENVTSLGNGVWMLKHSHVGHDAVIGDKVTISCGGKIGGHAIIGPGSNIGLNACVHQWVDMPAGCMIGMNAAVTKKLVMEAFRKYAGVPAKDIGSNLRKTVSETLDEIQKAEHQQLIWGDVMKPKQELWDKIKTNPKLQVLGESQGKYIFVIKGLKTSPVMILVPSEGKVYTSGLGLLCHDEEGLITIFKLLGHDLG